MPVTKKGIGMLVVVSRGLRDGVRGRTLKSAELHHDGVRNVTKTKPNVAFAVSRLTRLRALWGHMHRTCTTHV